MTKSLSLPPLTVAPGSRYDNFFRVHPETPYVWHNILADSEDLAANVPTPHDKALFSTVLQDVIIPFFLRSEMAVEDNISKWKIKPLVGDIVRDVFQETPKLFADMLTQKFPLCAKEISEIENRQDLILVDIYGYEQQDAVRAFFARLKDEMREFRARPMYNESDKKFFQLIVLGGSKK